MFYSATLAPLRRYLARLVGNGAEAQDLAQDAYVRVYQAVHERGASNSQAYLYATARNLALNRLRRRRLEPLLGTDAAAMEKVSSGLPEVRSVVMARQELEHLERVILELPAGCRTVLLLRRVEGLSHEEIAEHLDISRSTVEKHLARAARLLREGMGEMGAAARADEEESAVA